MSLTPVARFIEGVVDTGSNWPQVQLTQVANFPQVSLTCWYPTTSVVPVANLPAVLLIPVANFSLILVVHLDLQISPHILKKFEMTLILF